MKKIMCTFLLLCLLFPANSKHKVKRNTLRCHSATYSNIEGIRKVGNVFEFIVEVRRNGVLIDSVWFGASPVPCDVMDIKTRHRINQVLRKGEYLVRANRDLYANFPAEYDSTSVYEKFIPPFKFKGTAYLMFTFNEKRQYSMVQHAVKVAGKQLR